MSNLGTRLQMFWYKRRVNITVGSHGNQISSVSDPIQVVVKLPSYIYSKITTHAGIAILIVVHFNCNTVPDVILALSSHMCELQSNGPSTGVCLYVCIHLSAL